MTYTAGPNSGTDCSVLLGQGLELGGGGNDYYQVIIGHGAKSLRGEPKNTVVGALAEASYSDTVAIGYLSKAYGRGAIAIGSQARASSTSNIAIGDSASATGLNSATLGAFTASTLANSYIYGYDVDGANPTVHGFGTIAPTAKLTVVNPGSNDSFLVADQANDTSPFVIDASGNVGIGTTTSGVKLHVDGGVLLTIGAKPSAPVAAPYMQARATSSFSSDTIYSFWYQGGTGIANPALDTITFNTDYSERLRITSSGNIGIGTTSPAYKLDVYGDARIDGSLYDTTGSAGVNGYVLQSTAAGIQWVATSTLGFGGASASIAADSLDFTDFADALTLDTSTDILVTGSNVLSLTNTGTGNSFVVNDGAGDTTPFVIDASGNVGIGTTTPNSALTIIGDATARILEIHNNWAVGADLYSHSDTGFRAPVINLYKSKGTIDAPTAVTNGNQLGYLQLGGHGGRGYGRGIIIQGNAEENWSPSSGASSLSFLINPAGSFNDPIERMRIAASGNVGIGTTSPYAKLSVAGSVVAEYFQATSTTATSTFAGGFNAAGQFGFTVMGAGSRTEFLYDTTTGARAALEGSPYMMTYDFTQTPGYGLAFVTGLSSVPNTAAGQASSIFSNSFNTATGLYLRKFSSGVGDYFVAETSAGAPIFNVKSSGNVGIGTTSPTYKLDVYGDARIDGDLYDSAGSAGVSGYVLQSTAAGIEWVATTSLGFASAGSAHDAVTLAGGYDYLTLSGQQITLAQLDLGTDATGTLALDKGGTGAASFGANQITYINAGNTAMTSSANFTFDGTNLGLGGATGITFDGTRMFYATSTNDSIYIGDSAGGPYIGTSNTIIGDTAGADRTGGNYNTFLGAYAGQDLTVSSDSVLIGGGAGAGNGTSYEADNLTIIGTDAGYRLQTGAHNNILIGHRAADSLTTGASNIVIGYDIEAPSNTASNQLNIGNIIFGTGVDGAGTTVSSGNIGIGTTSPVTELSVAGDVYGENFYLVHDLSEGVKNTSNIGGIEGIGFWSGNFLRSAMYQSNLDFVNNFVVGWESGTDVTQSTLDISLSRLAAGVLGVGTGTQGEYDGTLIAGNVGIGTTSPWAKLSVTNTSSGPSFVVEDSTSPDTSPFIIDASGNVGIGTTTPSDKFVIYDGAGTHRISARGLTSNRPYWEFARDNQSAIWSAGMNPTGGVVGSNGFVISNGASQNQVFAIQDDAPAGAMYIQETTGNVGIASTTPWRKLSVTGTVGFDGLTGATGAGSLCLSANNEVVYNSASDACLPSLRETKHDIVSLNLSALDLVAALEPVSFVYNEGDGRTRYGFIAEEAMAVDAHLATYDAEGSVSGIDDRSILAILVSAIKELWVRLEENFARDDEQDAELEYLRARVEALEAALDSEPTARAPGGDDRPPLDSDFEPVSDDVDDEGDLGQLETHVSELTSEDFAAALETDELEAHEESVEPLEVEVIEPGTEAEEPSLTN